MKPLILYLLTLVLLVSCNASAANSPEAFVLNRDDAKKNQAIETLLERSTQLRQSEPVLAMEYAVRAFDESNRADDDFYRASSLVAMGATNYSLNNPSEGERCFEQSLALFTKIKNEEGEARVLRNLSIVANQEGKPKEWMVYVNKMMQLAEITSNETVKLIAYNTIGGMYYDIGDMPKAYENYLSASKFQGDNHLLIATLNDLGNVYTEMGNYNEAINCFEKIIYTNIAEYYPISRANAMSNLGDVYSTMKNYPKAIQMLNQAITLLKEYNDVQGLIYAYNYLGDVTIEVGDFAATEAAYRSSYEYALKSADSTSIAFSEMKLAELALAQNDFKTALKYLAYSKEFFKKEKIDRQLLTVYELYSEIYSAMGKHAESLEYYKLYTELTKKMADENLRHSLEVAQQKVDAEKEMQEARIQSEIEKANYSQMRNLFISLAVFTVLIAFAGYKYRSLTQQLKSRNRELAKLNEKQKIVYDALVDDLKASLFELTFQIAQLENQDIYDSLTNSYREFSAKYNELLQDVK